MDLCLRLAENFWRLNGLPLPRGFSASTKIIFGGFTATSAKIRLGGYRLRLGGYSRRRLICRSSPVRPPEVNACPQSQNA